MTEPETGRRRGVRKVLRGTVTSDKMDKTRTVVVERHADIRRTKKYVRRRTRLHAHDEKNEARVGDVVEVMETRPLSKLKRWRLVRILLRPEATEGVVP